MPIVNYTNDPKVTDKILFDLYTPMGNGCFTQDPESFDSIKIFFISRSLSNIKDFVTPETQEAPVLQRESYVATQEYCVAETDILRQALEARKNYVDSLLRASTILPAKLGSITYYTEAVNVFCQGVSCSFGTPPIWIAGEDNTSSIIQKVDDPELPNGHFAFIWEPGIIKDGDYYICYSYTMRVSSYKTETYTKYLSFYIASDIKNEVAVPTHACPPEKYFVLANAYMPKMYEQNYAKQDYSVFTLEALNKSVASSFTLQDNQASRLIDILNANVTPEPYLNQLAALFALNLRSTDTTRWRGQIITAVPQFKKKGTLEALAQAFEQAGMYLADYFQYWQITFPEVFTQTFTFVGDYNFILDQYTNNDLASEFLGLFELYISKVGTKEFISKNMSFVSFSQNVDGQTIMTWDSSSQNLTVGDIVKITYVTQTLNSSQIALYEYWRDILPLMDLRPFFSITPTMPPKNWNVRLIAASDPLFRVFIPVLNPYTDPVVFGKVRTVFPYSENVYNMDEYNGSLRDSTNPEDIGAEFLEPCSGGISAYYSVNLVIQDLTDFRLTEVFGILNDYVPFHAILHSISYSGYLSDFVMPPIENIEVILRYNINEYCIAGDAQYAFLRIGMIHDFTSPYQQANGLVTVTRSDLAPSPTLEQTGTLTLYNENLVIEPFLHTNNFQSIAISPSSCMLEILDGPYVGQYPNIIGSVEPFALVMTSAAAQAFGPVITGSNFTFQISNYLTGSNFDVIDASQFSLSTASENIGLFNIKTVQNDGASAAWTVEFNSNTYKILYVNNDELYLENNSSAPLPTSSSSDEFFRLVNTQTSETMFTVTDGIFRACVIAKFTSTNSPQFTVANLCIGAPETNLQITDDGGTTFYSMYSIVPDDIYSFYVLDYTAGFTATSVLVDVYNRLITTVGAFSYTGLIASAAWPTFYNPEQVTAHSSLIPENSLLDINIGGNDYTYTPQIDFSGGSSITPSSIRILGYFVNAGTIDTNPAGINYTYNLYRYTEYEQPGVVPAITGQNLYFVHRSGQTVWGSTTQTGGTPFAMNMTNKNPDSNSGDSYQEFIRNTENINIVIETKTGEKYEGELK
jgi:hypothetical protein